MLREKVIGAKMRDNVLKTDLNLTIAHPVDTNDTDFKNSDLLLAKDVVKVASSSQDVSDLKTKVSTINDELTKANKEITELQNKVSNISTELFKIVTELPEAKDADKNKIYCVLATSQSAQAIEAQQPAVVNEDGTSTQATTDDKNRYIEYIAIQEDSTWNWEKVGEFKAEPDLSNYAKLSGARFMGQVHFLSPVFLRSEWTPRGYLIDTNNKYLCAKTNSSPTKAYVTNGDLAEIGTTETFTFTLSDGSTVTKDIRVISTTKY